MIKKILLAVLLSVILFFSILNKFGIEPFSNIENYLIHRFDIILIVLFISLVAGILFLYQLFFSNSSKKDLFNSFVILIFFSVLLKLFLSIILPFTNDEGSYLYDALLISQNSSPFYFSFARSPVLIYLLAVFVKLFDSHYLVGRLFSIFFSIGIAYFMFLIGKLIKKDKFGYLSAYIFLYFPSMVYDTVYIHTQPLAYFFVISSFYFLLKYINFRFNKNLVITFVLLSLGVLVRETVLLFLPFWLMVLFVINYKNNTKKAIVDVILGICVFISIALFTWLIIALFVGFEKVLYDLKALVSMRSSTLGYFFQLNKKIYLLKLNLVYLYGLIVFFLTSFSIFLSNYFARFKLLIIFIVGMIFMLFYIWLPQTIALVQLNDIRVILLLSFSFFAFLLLYYIYSVDFLTNSKNIHLIYFAGLAVIPSIFYFFVYSNFQTEYWIEFLIPLVLLFSYLLSVIFKKNGKYLNKSLFILFVLMICFNLISLYKVYLTPQRGTYSIENLVKVKKYLNSFSPNSEIFTAAVIIPFISGNDLALNIAHPAIYSYNSLSRDFIYKLFPTEDQIINYLEKEKVPFILIEKITKDSFLTHTDKIKFFIDANYVFDRTIGNDNPIDIYKKR